MMLRTAMRLRFISVRTRVEPRATAIGCSGKDGAIMDVKSHSAKDCRRRACLNLVVGGFTHSARA